MIRVGTEDFDLSTELKRLENHNHQVGAVVAFVGLVRDFAPEGSSDTSMTLEHYPGMTEAQLEDIEAQARSRWELQDVTIIHRVGRLEPGDQIVAVLAASRHRQNAFDAANFIMDILKTNATFWKKESVGDEGAWVEAHDSDDAAARRWVY